MLEFARSAESAFLTTMGLFGHAGYMPNVTSLLIVTNTTSFILPMAFSDGLLDISGA
jgi:hypothetical protein